MKLTILCASCLLLTTLAGAQAADTPTQPVGQWLGQDGRDLTNPSASPGGNDVQDVHIRVTGLPTDRQIASGVLRGYGGGEWNYNGGGRTWKIVLERAQGSPTADFYFDPGSFDPARHWDFELTYDDGSKHNVSLEGKRFNPDLRMPAAAMKAVWMGQDRHDFTGPGPAVGPDGFQDVHLAITGLSAKVEIQSLAIAVDGHTHWEFGMNPDGLANAELFREQNDPSRADLYFSPNSEMNGRQLTLKLQYAPGQGDSTTLPAGSTNPSRRMPPPPALHIVPMRLLIEWKGQDNPASRLVHLVVRRLPAGRPVTAVFLSDPVGGSWAYAAPGEAPYIPSAGESRPPVGSLINRPGAVPGQANLYFSPVREAKGSRMILRFQFKDGSAGFVGLKAGHCDLNPRSTGSAAPRRTANTGDDLQALVAQGGEIRLQPGRYHLDRPLDLPRSVALRGSPGAVLEFSQPAGAAPWENAITIHRSFTTLQGLTIRFTGSIRWLTPAGWDSPAIIGADRHTDDPRSMIVIDGMDIEAPPIATGLPLQWEPATMRLNDSASGAITGNIIKGGVCDMMHGPWTVTGNDYRGAMPDSFDYSAFAMHYTHDVVVARNLVHAVGPSGKNWRFLVMTQSGANDIVKDNMVRDVGPRDNDTIPNPNAPELTLTEAYRLHFEGHIAGVDAGASVVQIPLIPEDPVRTGDVISILDGPHAGEWRRVAQAISPQAFLLEQPLPKDVSDISISTGFVGETFQGNTIDAGISSISACMVLAGNHFGTRVIDNSTSGGRDALLFYATPTEKPNIWGWSHAPALGIDVENNRWADSLRGVTITVQHDRKYIKSNRGRIYLSGTVRNNHLVWSTSFLHRLNQTKPGQFNLGDPNSIDPAEAKLNILNNGLVRVIAASKTPH